MKKNAIKITRIPGTGKALIATISIQFDPENAEATERFARLLRELIPEDEREQFVEDWNAAASAAGFTPR